MMFYVWMFIFYLSMQCIPFVLFLICSLALLSYWCDILALMMLTNETIQVRNLESCRASQEELRDFEYSFLGEVRMLGALRKHSCIVEIYGHQLFSKWAPPVDGIKENRLLQSIIFMEYIKGGSVKVSQRSDMSIILLFYCKDFVL